MDGTATDNSADRRPHAAAAPKGVGSPSQEEGDQLRAYRGPPDEYEHEAFLEDRYEARRRRGWDW